MRRLHPYVEFLSGYVLVGFRNFSSAILDGSGNYAVGRSRLPSLTEVELRLKREGLILADAREIVNGFKKEHERFFRQNIVFGRSSNQIRWAYFNPRLIYNFELEVGDGFDLGFEQKAFKEVLAGEIMVPMGYTGEICLLAYREES